MAAGLPVRDSERPFEDIMPTRLALLEQPCINLLTDVTQLVETFLARLIHEEFGDFIQVETKLKDIVHLWLEKECLRSKPKKEKSLLDLMYMVLIKPALKTSYDPNPKLKEGPNGQVYINGRTGVECQRAKINVYFEVVKDGLHQSITKFIQTEMLFGEECFIVRFVNEIEDICDDLVELMTDYDGEAQKVEDNLKEI